MVILMLRWRTLCHLLKELDIPVTMVPDNQTSMASKMFTLMSLGRGSQVAGEMVRPYPYLYPYPLIVI